MSAVIAALKKTRELLQAADDYAHDKLGQVDEFVHAQLVKLDELIARLEGAFASGDAGECDDWVAAAEAELRALAA